MKIKIIKDFKAEGNWIRVGNEFLVRKFPTGILSVIDFAPYQVIEGGLSGTIIPREVCIQLSDEKVYTEKEWNDLKEHHLEQLKNERKQSASFQEAGRLLTEIVKEKNKEIERLNFFVDVLSVALKTACDSISVMQQQDKYKTRS